MSFPTIQPSQSFNLILGDYFTNYLVSSGGGTWSAYGLPSGLEIDPNTGEIFGTPIESGGISSYIVLTNNEGNCGAVVKFSIIDFYKNAFNITISPDIGYADSTKYKFTTNAIQSISAYSLLWNFGDGTVSNSPTPTHSFDLPGKYNISLYAYTSSGIKSLSSVLDVHLLINESVYFEIVPPPTFAGHYQRYPFKINFTSSSEGPHIIDLGAQFSRSYESQQPINKWSFLRPEWRFLDVDGNPITEIIPKGTKIYANDLGKITNDGTGFVVGVTGTAEFYFIDDVYNYDLYASGKPYTTIIATLRTSQLRSPSDGYSADHRLTGFSNSLATVSCPYVFLYRPADVLKITENGSRDYINPRWGNAEQPIIINTNFEKPYPQPYYWDDETNDVKIYNPEYNFAHYIPIEGDPVIVNIATTGISSYFVPEPTEFKWIDSTGYKTPGYYKGKFYTNTIESFNAVITAYSLIKYPVLSSQYFNPHLWLSNPEAGLMSTVQYVYNESLSAAVTTPNQNIAQVYNFEMPIVTDVDFEKDPMALSGFHGIHSIAATHMPAYHAWALDSELNYLYRLTTNGNILCAIDINKIVSDNKLGFLSTDQVSPASIVLDSNQNIWMTLYDTISTLKFDRWGNFLFATTPLSSTGYIFPPIPDMEPPWYAQNSYYDYDESSEYDWNRVNNVDINFIEPTGIDSDTQDNVWVSYSNFASGYLIKYDINGNILYSHAYPLCSCPQQIAIDTNDDVWVALSNNIWDSYCTLEKRSSTGTLLSSFHPIKGLNYLTLDYEQNIWFTFSYSWIGSINKNTGEIFTTNLSGTNHSVYAADWFDPNDNTDETALEGIACDLQGRVYVVNSIENQIYVLDTKTKKFLNKFYVNPQGFTFYISNQQGETRMLASLWNKSLQASGDWTGLRWFSKYGYKLPYYTSSTMYVPTTGQSRYLNFVNNPAIDIFKKNENFDLAGQMKSFAFMPSLADSNFLFESFLSSIYGKYPFYHNDVGVTLYEKIANFVSNNRSVDYCNLDQLYSMTKEVGIEGEDFVLKFPPDIKRIVDYATINITRLLGARSLQQTAFKSLNSQGKSNKGDLISSLSYTITAGNPVILKDRSINKYRLIQTGQISGLDTYPLSTLATFIGLVDVNWPSYYEFYTFIPVYDNTQLEGIIDWDSPQTTLNENLSSEKFWLGSEGFIETKLSYELYKGLGLLSD